jgi:Flp pilus assembly protein TadB
MSVLGAVAIGIAAAAATMALLVRDVRWPTRAAPWWRGWREVRASRTTALAILRSTHAALRSGVPLAPALRLALDASPPAGAGPFLRALRAFELNVPLADSLRTISAGVSDRAVAIAVNALAIASVEDLSASRTAAIIDSVADRLAFDVRLREEIAARTNGLQVQVVLLALVVPGIAAYLLATLPGLGDTLASPLGLYVLVPAAALLEIAGIVASRAIVRGAVP